MVKVSSQKWEETLPHGPPLCALCIGNDHYVSSSFGPLSSCAKDAKAVAAQVHNRLQRAGAWAKVECNIRDKAAMELELKDFLRQIRRPPRIVLIYFSGHGVQEGDEIFLVPTHASPSTVEELRALCLSHDELFRILKTDLEERDVPDEVTTRIRVEDIVFLVVLDTCRSRLGGVEVEESYSAELDPKSPPNVWALCTATSRHKEAFENPAISSELSAFTHYLLSEDVGCGLFGLNTPVKSALEAACNKLREHVKGKRQDPTLMGLDRIPSDFCLLRDEAPSRQCDVCVCYRRDTDQEHANFICDKLRIAAPTISLSDYAAGMEDVHIASSIAHSKIVILIVSEKTFGGIDALYDKSSCEGPLARLLLQCELIVEIYGLQQERLKVLPICFGVEGDGAGGGRVFSDVDAEALWPANPLSFPVKSIADRSKMLLRADGLQLAQGLNKSNLRIRSRNVASLMSGRHIRDTLLVLKEFTKQKLFGCKHTEGERVSQEIIKLLDFSKRTRPQTAVEAACQRLGNSAGSSGQKPVSVCLDQIPPGFCLFPASSEPGADPTTGIPCYGLKVVEGSDEAGKVSGRQSGQDKSSDLENFLTEIGVPHLLSELRDQAGIQTLDNLMSACKRGCLERIDMPAARSWMLKDLIDGVRRRLIQSKKERLLEENVPRPLQDGLALCRDVTAKWMSPDDDASSVASQSSTLPSQSPGNLSDFSDGDSEGENEDRVVVAARNCGDIGDLELNLKSFIIYGVQSENSSFCVLLWMMFLRGAQCKRSHAMKMEKWLRSITATDCMQEDEVSNKVHTFVMEDITSHLLLHHVQERARNFSSRPCVASIAVVDHMVQDLLRKDARIHKDTSKLLCWQKHAENWYISDIETPKDFFDFANDFLFTDVDGASLILEGVLTTSYVAFMEMSSLSAFLLFGFLENRKFMLASNAGTNSDEVLQGFCSFVSSAGHVFSATEADMPARGSIPLIIQGLRCMSAGPTPASSVPVSTYTSRQGTRTVSSLSTSKRVSGRASRHEPSVCPATNLASNAAEETIKASMRALGNIEEDVNKERAQDIFYDDADARVAIQTYLQRLIEQDKDQKGTLSVGSFIDSASGEERRVDDGSIALELLSRSSFLDECNQIENAVIEDLRCPISRGLLLDPVTCSDGRTYERACIVEMFRKAETELDEKNKKKIFGHLKSDGVDTFAFRSPMPPHEELKFKEAFGRRDLLFNAEICEEFGVKNKEIHDKIKDFKELKLRDLNRMKQNAEGEDEKRILRNRHGYAAQAVGATELQGEVFDSAKEFFGWIVDGSRHMKGTPEEALPGVTGQCLACLTGPPASGKTVAMQQIVYAAAKDCRAKMKTLGEMPLLPLFMRAAVLSKLISDRFESASLSTSDANLPGKLEILLREVVEMFLAHGIEEDVFLEDSKEVILNLYDFDRVLICIDGLDEAAAHQELLEKSIERAVRNAKQQKRRLHVLISTREHSYVHSRACLRLGDFHVVHLQPLNEARQKKMIEGRISSEKVDTFCQQLAAIAGNHQELTTSPFLLSLMIEVYQKEDKIPTQRVELYEKQVTAIVSRCVVGKIQDCEDASGALEDKKREVATQYLEVLAFVCQMRLSKRDFKLAECTSHVAELWQDSEDARSEAQQVLFTSPIVGLLADVGDESYRFSHLTLQEYLAARCAVRLYGHDVQELLAHLRQGDALFSRWKREVLQFTACMLPEDTFSQFCRVLLEMEDGTGTYCELVKGFSKERDSSDAVEKMMSEQMQKIRGTDILVAGLCHPSSEMRSLVLSEMIQFCVPPNPFADGTVPKLKAIAEDKDRVWHTRAASMLSIAQIAQMKHWESFRSDRAETIKWMLKMLESDTDVLKNVHFALIKALGTILKQDKSGASEGIKLRQEDESVVLQPGLRGNMAVEFNIAVVNAWSDLGLFSEALVDWLQDEPSLIAEGTWPIRHVQFLCERVAVSNDFERASRLADSLLHRLHSYSFIQSDRLLLLKGLDNVRGLLSEDALSRMMLPFLEVGDAEQRARVLEAAVELKMEFGGQETSSNLARCLLLDVMPKRAADSTKISLLSYILEKEGKVQESSLRENSAVFVFLLNSMQQSIGCSQISGSQNARRKMKRALKKISIVARHLLEFESAHDEQENKQVEKERPGQEGREGSGKLDQSKRPNEPPAFCSRHSRADAELKSALDDLLKRFTPDILGHDKRFTPDILAPSTTTEHACEHYYAASLWTASGLLQDTSAEKIATWLQLDEEDSVLVQDTYAALKHLQEPWLQGVTGANGEWEAQVLEMLQFEALGPFVFGILLSHVRDKTKKEPSSALEEFTLLSETIQKWDANTVDKRLASQYLLKELCIGRRDAQLPTWSGAVTKHENELVRFLKAKGLSTIAARFSEAIGMELVADLSHLQAEDLEDPDLSFLRRWQKQKLMDLVQSITAAAARPGDRFDDDGAVWGSASGSGDDVDSRFDAALAKHPGNPEDFQENMKGFITDLLEYMSIAAPDEASQVFTVPLSGHNHEWSYCMLVWMRFAKDAYFDGIWREKWRECITFPSPDRLLAMLDSCLQQESTSHKWWTRAEFKRLGCNKPFAAAIFVTDVMVQQSLKGHAASGLAWQQDVVKSWFTNGEEASTFVLRANKFLREHFVNGTSAVTQVVETQ